MSGIYFEESKPFTLEEHEKILKLFRQGRLSFESAYISTEKHEWKLIEISLVPENKAFSITTKFVEKDE